MNARSSISSATEPAQIDTILDFWRQAGPARWFAADPGFDQAIRERFESLHMMASQGLLAAWEQDAAGTLALLLLTDQFPRNLYRGSAHAFASDAIARAVAERAIERGFDRACDPMMRSFFYLPFMHHEDMASQLRALVLYEKLVGEGGDIEGLRYARLHADLIARFGRFPHRNPMMGRISTPEETAYLAQGGFAG
jgi:uncharacterized protein (DUF924 family)